MNSGDCEPYIFDEHWKEKFLEQNLGASEGGGWHPQDKAWMSKRKEEWRNVKESLDVLSANWPPFKRKYHKYHKELFFYGTLNPDCRSEADIRRAMPIGNFLATGQTPFLSMLPIFKLWYHPEPEVIDLDALRDIFIHRVNFHVSRDDFLSSYWAMGAGFYGKVYSPVYGMMGGREELVVRFFFPGLDYRQPATEGVDVKFNGASMRPHTLMRTCSAGTAKELRKDAAFVPYAPGQYLWDHMSFNLEYYPDEVFADSDNKNADYWRTRFKVIITELLTFEIRQDRSRHRPTTIAMAEKLVGQYERKEFSDAMLDLWDESKREVKPLSKMHRQLFYEDNETLATCCGEFPIEEMERRVERWKQV